MGKMLRPGNSGSKKGCWWRANHIPFNKIQLFSLSYVERSSAVQL